jgi:hypothetical protein
VLLFRSDPSRAPLEEQAAKPTIQFPSIEQVRWRTDVTISTASLERVFRPTVMMQVCSLSEVLPSFDIPFVIVPLSYCADDLSQH